MSGSLNGSEMGLGLGLGMVGRETDRDRDVVGGVGVVGTADLLCGLSDVRRSQESLLDSPHNPGSASNPGQAPPSSISSISQTNKGINVKVRAWVVVCCLCDCRVVCVLSDEKITRLPAGGKVWFSSTPALSSANIPVISSASRFGSFANPSAPRVQRLGRNFNLGNINLSAESVLRGSRFIHTRRLRAGKKKKVF